MIVATFILLFVPIPQAPWSVLSPVVLESSTALASTSEIALAESLSLFGLLFQASKNMTKKMLIFTVRQGIQASLKSNLSRQLKEKPILLFDLQHAKVIFNESYRPKKNKQLLYYIALQFKGERYYKIGITQKSLKGRYRREYHTAHIEPIVMFEMPAKSAIAIEKIVKTTFIKQRFNNRKVLAKDGGYSEVYSKDILHFDNASVKLLHQLKS